MLPVPPDPLAEDAGGAANDADPADPPLIGWARLAHRLARSSGGSGIGAARQVDGSLGQMRVTVTPVGLWAPEAGVEPAESPAGAVPNASPRPGIPAQARGSLPAAPPDQADSADADAEPCVAAPEGTAWSDSRATVTPVGTVDTLPSPEHPTWWLVEIEPVADSVAEAEAARSAAEHRFAALAGCAPVGIFASDAGLRLGYVNDHLVALTGTPAHALLGNGWLDVIHSEDLPAVYTAVQTVLGGSPVALAVRMAGNASRQRWLQLRLSPTTTPARAAGFIGTAEDVTERRTREEHLTYQAQHDPLTGLANRRRLIEVLTDLLSGRRGRDREFAVLFLDLDGFKEVNDRLGHERGDAVLVEAADRIATSLGRRGTVGRLGGDEFLVVLPPLAEDELVGIADRILEHLNEPWPEGGAITASIGIATSVPYESADRLLDRADTAMYDAKSCGRARWRTAS
jgi:diguanylate cyclase (GGDEF)-like protein/PAS domain S-box-containing protein